MTIVSAVQTQLENLLGWAQKTVSNNMDKLLQAEWNGLKQLTRSLEADKVKYSKYKTVKSNYQNLTCHKQITFQG